MNYRFSSNTADGAGCGCFGFIVYLFVMGLVSLFLGDWLVSTLGGADALANWHEIPMLIRAPVLFMLGGALAPLCVITLLLSVFGVTPLF